MAASALVAALLIRPSAFAKATADESATLSPRSAKGEGSSRLRLLNIPWC